MDSHKLSGRSYNRVGLAGPVLPKSLSSDCFPYYFGLASVATLEPPRCAESRRFEMNTSDLIDAILWL